MLWGEDSAIVLSACAHLFESSIILSIRVVLGQLGNGRAEYCHVAKWLLAVAAEHFQQPCVGCHWSDQKLRRPATVAENKEKVLPFVNIANFFARVSAVATVVLMFSLPSAP